MIVVFAGGVGAARFLEGVVQAVPAEQVTVIVNTGDDMTMHGLRICADFDIVTCTLAGVIDQAQGWGIAGDTTECMTWLAKLGAPDWFKLGDRDLAIHIRRTQLLNEGIPLHEVGDQIRQALGVASTILPMTNTPVETYIHTPIGRMHFEEYFVRHRTQIEVQRVEYEGAEQAAPAPGVVEAIHAARAILIAPSNPIVSVGTILAIPGVREALRSTAAPVVAVSPLVGGKAIKGPAVPLMIAHGYQPSAVGVAECYADFLDGIVIDHADADLAETIRAQGLHVTVTDTIMRGLPEKRALAEAALSNAQQIMAA
jgi:LPPG:FO 2-phospho-L-lactate transferase